MPSSKWQQFCLGLNEFNTVRPWLNTCHFADWRTSETIGAGIRAIFSKVHPSSPLRLFVHDPPPRLALTDFWNVRRQESTPFVSKAHLLCGAYVTGGVPPARVPFWAKFPHSRVYFWLDFRSQGPNFGWGSVAKGLFSATFGHFDLIPPFSSKWQNLGQIWPISCKIAKCFANLVILPIVKGLILTHFP